MDDIALTSPCSTQPAADLPGLPPVPLFPELPKTGDDHFDRAIQVVFHHEGYFSSDPDDPGGPTKFGISLRAARQLGDFMDVDGDGDVDEMDIRGLTAEKAVRVYKQAFWDPFPYDELGLAVGIKVFDLAVNMGPKQAHLCLQRAIRAVRSPDTEPLKEDGVIGPKTLRAAATCYTPVLLAALLTESKGSANESVLHYGLEDLGHRHLPRATIREDIRFLIDQGLVVDEFFGSVQVCTITRRGVEVAEGRTEVEGVKKPALGI